MRGPMASRRRDRPQRSGLRGQQLDKAATASAVSTEVFNGAKVMATRVRRQDAIKEQVAELRRLIAEYMAD